MCIRDSAYTDKVKSKSNAYTNKVKSKSNAYTLNQKKTNINYFYSKSNKQRKIKCAKTNIKLEKKSKTNYYTFTHNVLVRCNAYEKFETIRNQMRIQ